MDLWRTFNIQTVALQKIFDFSFLQIPIPPYFLGKNQIIESENRTEFESWVLWGKIESVAFP
jgi:hypothetical protein